MKNIMKTKLEKIEERNQTPFAKKKFYFHKDGSTSPLEIKDENEEKKCDQNYLVIDLLIEDYLIKIYNADNKKIGPAIRKRLDKFNISTEYKLLKRTLLLSVICFFGIIFIAIQLNNHITNWKEKMKNVEKNIEDIKQEVMIENRKKIKINK